MSWRGERVAGLGGSAVSVVALLWLALVPPANAEEVIRLHPDHPAGASEQIEVQGGLRTLRNVTDPTIEVFLPRPDRSSGAGRG